MNDLKVIEAPIKGKVCVVVGTRPGIIKMSPIINELQRRRANFFVLHAGQHYSYNMDRKFFQDLELPNPECRLENMQNYSLHGEQTAEMLRGIEKILIEERPEVVLVCGDANCNLAGALAARKLRLKVGHVEAGLRSNDWGMPEEHNRVMIDHISEYLFAPTEKARQNALEDSVRGKIFVTGSTVVDAITYIREITEKKRSILEELGLEAYKYFLITAHREENVDTRDYLIEIIEAIKSISDKYNLPVVYPVHPRTRKRINQFGLDDIENKIQYLRMIEPLGYMDFVSLVSKARLVLTDSGGLQQEACILGTPTVTFRRETEWVETVEVGANFIAGIDRGAILRGVEKQLKANRNWQNPFGEGGAAKRILDILESYI